MIFSDQFYKEGEDLQLLILADDFTGALDTGVQLSKQNIPTTVMVSAEDTIRFPAEKCEVLSINAQTRHLSQKEAYLRIRRLLEKYAVPGRYIYIKTDSALRGNIGPAFGAALDTIGAPICFVPALPALNRTTKKGVCYIAGQLLENSVFRNDPRTPTHKSYIPDILKNDLSDFTCRTIAYDEVAGLDRIRRETPADVYLFDCESQEQLTAIGNALAARHLYGLTAGCAGFASTFSAHIPFHTRIALHVKRPGPLLFVSGSANAITLGQLACAASHGITVISLSAPIYEAYKSGVPADTQTLYACIRALSCLRSGESVILATAACAKELHAVDDAVFHETVAKTMASLVQYLLNEADIQTLAVFGGDMVAAILKRISCTSVDACGEITAGVPVCTFSYGGQTRSLVTKSGGFGDPDVVLRIMQFFDEIPN